MAPTISEKYDPKPQPAASKPQFGKKVEAKEPKWKIQSQELQNAMKQQRMIKAIQEKGGDLSSLPPPPRSNYDHYVECRYCGRKYAPEVAERHIPKCANIINKPGGIQTSKIQDKYVKGTGTATKSGIKPPVMASNPVASKVQPAPNKLASKPQMLAKKRWLFFGSTNSISSAIVATSHLFGEVLDVVLENWDQQVDVFAFEVVVSYIVHLDAELAFAPAPLLYLLELYFCGDTLAVGADHQEGTRLDA